MSKKRYLISSEQEIVDVDEAIKVAEVDEVVKVVDVGPDTEIDIDHPDDEVEKTFNNAANKHSKGPIAKVLYEAAAELRNKESICLTEEEKLDKKIKALKDKAKAWHDAAKILSEKADYFSAKADKYLVD